ncbi:MAG TPA: 6-phosphofructokinase [Thermoanaerobacter sp.]|nr:6-phosphofructokinase [Thermoanaerobacter sp.]
MKKNLVFAQSGGPTSVINASCYGIIKEALKYGVKIYGARFGIEGILNDNLVEVTNISENDLDLLRYSPSAAFGSCRHKLKDEDFEKVCSVLDKYEIGYFIYIGGNDSMDTAHRLSEHMKKICKDVKIVGVPKTIDNDLVSTHFCPGYGSAAKYIASSIREMAFDAEVYAKDIVTIVETMGRNSGFLAASSALARDNSINSPHLIYFPEITFDEKEFLDDVKTAFKDNCGKVFIVTSEGLKNKEGNYVYLKEQKADAFGNIQMGGVGNYMKQLVTENISKRVKVVELSILQRCAAHIASLIDNEAAVMVGKEAVNKLMNGICDVMISIEKAESGFKAGTVPLSEVANRTKFLPSHWIDSKNRWVTQDAIDYMLPLIQGEVKVPYVEGLPKYIRFI